MDGKHVWKEGCGLTKKGVLLVKFQGRSMMYVEVHFLYMFYEKED